MSTEKSLLAYESVVDSIKSINTEIEGIAVPIGVTPCGVVDCAKLLDKRNTSNFAVFGLTGSGRAKYIQFLIRSLIDLYGMNMEINYIDGANCEVNKWRETQRHGCLIPKPGVLTGCKDPNEFADAVHLIKEKVTLSLDTKVRKSRVVVFDNVSGVLPYCSVSVQWDIKFILENGPFSGMHTIWTSEDPEHDIDVIGVKRFDLVATTRVNRKSSDSLYGNGEGTMVRKYGDIVYSYLGNQSKLRVPYVL